MNPLASRLAAVLAATLLTAPRIAGATVETLYDNDTNAMVPGAATTDRNYTFGAHTTWYARPGSVPAALARAASRWLGSSADGTQRLALSFGQELYTPDALSNPNPIPGDRPYAAWLYGGATLSNTTATRARALDVRVGVVGPMAQGQAVQDWWHRRTHVRAPRGWRWQLANEPGVRASFDERWRPWGYRRHADLVPHARITVGNVLTEAAAGATVRLGLPLPDDFGPGAPSGPDDRGAGPRLFAFGRVEGRAVAHDILLDGNTLHRGMHVTRVPLVGEAQLGCGARWGRLGARYTFSYTTGQFRERLDAQEYGSFGFSF